MKKKSMGKNILKSNKGSLTVDFIFGMTLCFISMAVFFAMSFSLSVVEISQYIAFASARTYNAAHISQEKQAERAADKFNILTNSPSFKTFLKDSDWFELKIRKIGDKETFVQDFPLSADNPRNLFVGVQLSFKASMLDMSLPFVGNSSDEEGFSSNINAFLGREPSFNECIENFHNQKATLLSGLGYNIPGGANAIKVIIDNGC